MFGLESGQYYWIDITISLILVGIGFGIGYFVRSKKQSKEEIVEKVL